MYKGVLQMVTWETLIAFLTLIIAIIKLVIDNDKRDK